MNKDSERICRICGQCFCCENCKFKHETKYHKIYENCEICIYGRTLLKKPSEKLLQHVKNTHLPLHCLFCKILFSTIEDLVFRHQCTGPKSDNKDFRDYQSPPTGILYKSIITSSNKYFPTPNNANYLTSTPMQRNDNGEYKEIPDVITPVDYPANFSDKMSIESSKCSETPVSYNQEAKIKIPAEEKINTELLITTPRELVTQDSSTSWESALIDQNPVTPNQIITSPYPETSQNFSVSELYLSSEYTSEDLSLSAKKLKSISPRIMLEEKSKCKSPFSLEDIAEEPSECSDQNTNPNISHDKSFNQSTKSSFTNRNKSVWNTVANVWKSAWKGLSQTSKTGEVHNVQEKTIKRTQPDEQSEDAPDVKRFKIADIQCRETIHMVPTLRFINHTKKVVLCYDKAVQTD